MKPHLLLLVLCLSTVAGSAETSAEPKIGDVGPAIDVSPWLFQRQVQFKEAGVIMLEIPPEVLARAANDLHDMRVVRDGHQLPFIAIKPGMEREMEVPIAEVSSAQGPTWSAWELQMPYPNFPASELLLESPTPVFARTLVVSEQRETEQGRFERILSQTNWLRQAGQPAGTFHLGLFSAPRAGSIRIATDNGSNPRLKITSARVVYPVVQLLFRVPDTTPVHLCYGNQGAPYTRHDLQFSRFEYETASQVAATLGTEERLAGSAVGSRLASGSSPWLWSALALAAGVLLWLAAKKLPKRKAGGG